jgi:hypothetical protein
VDLAVINLKELITSQIPHPITLDMQNLNIRIHRDITGEGWFVDGGIVKTKVYSPQPFFEYKDYSVNGRFDPLFRYF